ncbi:MAG TPA: tape measure protein [Ruminiclostridium sp.]|nr:tape measure protein [Ruminiclostridium sp.]
MVTVSNSLQVVNQARAAFDSFSATLNASYCKTINRTMNNSLSYVNNSTNNIRKRFELFRVEINKGINTKNIDEVTKSFSDMAAAMSSAMKNFNKLNNLSDKGINTGGANTAAQKTNQSKSKLESINSGITGFEGALSNVKSAVWPKAKSLMDMSDKYSNQNGDLDSIRGQKTRNEARNQIYTAARNSRSSYDQTLNTVSRLKSTAGGSFKTTDEMVYFTEMMNKALVGKDSSSKAAGIDAVVKAMQTGRLKGNDLVSVMDKAPGLADAVKNYTGAPVNYDKGVSANVLKNSLYNSAGSINDAFATTPATFQDLGQMFADSIMNAFGPVFQTLINAASWINNNWSTLAPIFWGLAAAAAAFAIGLGVLKIVILMITLAQAGLNIAMIACPLFLVALLIGVIIGLIVNWIQSVGGIHVAWLIVVNAVLLAWDVLKIGFFEGVYRVIDLWNLMMLSIRSASVGIQNFMGDMKVGVLIILQDMVNGAIGIINNFIGLLNKIPGVSIQAIGKVDFGATAKMQNEAEKKAREMKLEDYRKNVESGITEHANEITQMKTNAMNNFNQRQLEIDKEKKAALGRSQKSPVFAPDKYNKLTTGLVAGGTKAGGLSNYANNQALQNNIANTAANTGAMKNTMDVTGEDLKYMRDIAEQEVINRFTTSEIKVDMTNHNNINSNLDLDGVVSYMEKKVYETLSVAAEGVHE